MSTQRHWHILYIIFVVHVSWFVLHSQTEPIEEKPEHTFEEDVVKKEDEIKKRQELIRQKEQRIINLKQQPTWTPSNQETMLLQAQIDDLRKQNLQLEEELETALGQQDKKDTQIIEQELKELEEETQEIYSDESIPEEFEQDHEELKELFKKCLTQWLAQYIAPQQTEQWQLLMQQYNQAAQDLLEYEYKTYPNQQNWTTQQWESFEQEIIKSTEKNQQGGSSALNDTYYNLIKKVRFYKQQLENLSHKKLPLRPTLNNECNELLKKMAKKEGALP